MSKRKKIIIWVLGSLGVLLVILLTFQVIVPRLVNLESIKGKILASVSEKIGGEVKCQKIGLLFFPYPHAVIDQVTLSIPGKVRGTVESLGLYVKIRPLFSGKLHPAEIQIETPDLKITLPKKPEGSKEGKEATPPADFEKTLSQLLVPLALEAPDLIVEMENGRFDLSEEGQSLFFFSNTHAHIVFPPSGLKIRLTCASNLWDKIDLKGSLDSDDLKGEGRIALTNFQPHKLTTYLVPDASQRLVDSHVNLSLGFKFDGLKTLQADLEGSLPLLALQHGKEKVLIKGKNLKGALNVDEEKIAVSLRELSLGYPQLNLSAKLRLGQGIPKVNVELEGREVDVPSVRQVALALAGDVSDVREVFEIVKGGSVPLVTVKAQGPSFAKLGNLENILIEGSMTGGKIFVPDVALDLVDAKGDAVISRGILNGKNLEARLGNSWGRGGRLKLGLEGDDKTFHLDILVEADMAELPPTMKGLVDDKVFQEEISLIEDLKGNARGRLVLGESTKSVKVRVDASEFNFSAKYKRIPYPLEMGGGRFIYSETGISVENLNGKLGNSSFSELSAALDLQKKPYLVVNSGKADILIDEIYPWLRSLGRYAVTEDVKTLKGSIQFSQLALEVPLLNPRDFQSRTSGEMRNIVLDSTLLPGPVELVGGHFEGHADLEKQKLSLRETQVYMLDASMTVSGVLNDYFKGPNNLDLSLDGDIGPESNRWVSSLLHIPPRLVLRTPLSLSKGRLIREKNFSTSFKGNLVLPGGESVAMDVFVSPEEFGFKNILVRNEASHASASFNLKERELSLQFTGNLERGTLNDLFAQGDSVHGRVEGDFRAYVSFDDPNKSEAEGHLAGEDLIFPYQLKIPLEVDRISLKAEKRHVDLERATLVSGSHQMDLNGSLDFSPPGLVFNMDAESNGISWTDIQGLLGKRVKKNGSEQGEASWDLPVKGTVRLKSEYFNYERFTWFPFHADITFARNEVDVKVIKGKICHITTPGSLKITPQDVSLDFDFASTNQELNPSVLCMSGQRSDITGRFDLLGKVKAKAKENKLLESLNGSLEFTAREGRIRRHVPLQRTFAYLNVTKSLSGQLPDMSKEEFVYNSITAKATIEDGKVILNEGIIDSPSMEIIGQGNVDYIRNRMDLMILVAPFKTVDWVVKKIPLVSRVLQGTLIAMPVKVTGDLADPKVSPMSASAIGSSLLDIVKRTVELPITVINAEDLGAKVTPVEPDE